MDPLCPPERRIIQEPVWSLIATTAAFMTAYLHFLHTYFNNSNLMILVLFGCFAVLAPSYLILRLGLSLLVFLVAAAFKPEVTLITFAEPLDDTSQRALALKFYHPKFIALCLWNPTFALIKVMNPYSGHRIIDAGNARSSTRANVEVFHVLGFAFTATQCIGVCILQTRRLRRSLASVTLVDIRVFETAFSCVLVLMQSAILENTGVGWRMSPNITEPPTAIFVDLLLLMFWAYQRLTWDALAESPNSIFPM